MLCGLLLMSLTACVGPSTSDMGAFRCDETAGLCIKLTADETIIVGQPFMVTILVTSDKDIPKLLISLSRGSGGKISFEEPSLKAWKGDGVNWLVDARAKQPLTFTRKVLLPAEEGVYTIIADAYIPGRYPVSDSISIYLTNDSGKVYYEGTRVPGWMPGIPELAVTCEPNTCPTPPPTSILFSTATSVPLGSPMIETPMIITVIVGSSSTPLLTP